MATTAAMQAQPDDAIIEIDAWQVHYRSLNDSLREIASGGARQIRLLNVCGQRYIGTDVNQPVHIEIYGTPGNDLGAFLDGPRIVVYGNAQDGCGNTMNDGEIVIRGRAGDIIGHSMRGGKIFVRDDVGYRVGIHMKEYEDKIPAIVIGGTAQHFLGEYMGGGVLIVLGLDRQQHLANFIGTGMHGGVIYMRGELAAYQLGREVGQVEMEQADRAVLAELVGQFAAHFGYDAGEILSGHFTKLIPLSLRPYGQIYAY
jgi:glutamate synthase domain-containing protein 3